MDNAVSSRRDTADGGNDADASRDAGGAVRSLSAEPIGAGEGIRTLDPDLGKVVLYP